MNSSTTPTDARTVHGAARRGASAAATALAAALCLLPSQRTAAQDVVITSEQKGAEVLALGLVRFPVTAGNARAVPYDPGEVIARDLELSGRFRVRTSPTFNAATKLTFETDGALAYVRGDYALEGDRHTLRAELVDLETGEIILRRNYAGPADELRRSAHRFADEMVYQLFGERGFAQTRIAYVSKRGKAKEIWIMDYDGANPRAVTRNGSINMNPVFLGGPDRMLYSSYAHGAPQFYTVDPDRPAPQPVYTTRGMNTAPAYNRVDRELAFASTMDGNSEIYRRPISGGRPERLTFSWTIETTPTWSPSGQELAFISDRSGRPMLYIMDRDGSNLRRITYDYTYVGSPAWSPRGDRIAFSAIDDGNNMNIYTVSPDGGDPARLTSGGSNESPAWSPDGRYLAFSSTRTGAAEIWVMRADGSELRRLTWTGGNTMPAWSPEQ